MTHSDATNMHTIIAILACIGVGLAIAWAGSDGGVLIQGMPLFFICASIGFILHWLVFLPAYVWQTEHYFDLTGSISFITTIIAANWLLGANPLENTRSLLLSLMVLIWAARLGSFLFMRVRRSGEDRRFRAIKPNFSRFLLTWTLGGLWVLFTIAAALAAITSGRNIPLGVLGYIGLALWLIGFLFEVLADYQKSAFRAQPENADKFMQSGLWSLSRHPNYFGEMLLWIGVAIVAAPVLQGWQYIALLSPLLVILLIYRVSGVPMLEARGQEKWGEDPQYRAYVRATPVLIPRLKKAKHNVEQKARSRTKQ